MATRVSYPVEVKMQVIEMRLVGISTKEVITSLASIAFTSIVGSFTDCSYCRFSRRLDHEVT
ncbi:hypothetical protein M3231_03275 [Neobacillus mesonae]|nr:hypothetical protein [Neobacillus mesonae]